MICNFEEHPCCCPDYNPCCCVDPDPNLIEENQVQVITIVPEPPPAYSEVELIAIAPGSLSVCTPAASAGERVYVHHM